MQKELMMGNHAIALEAIDAGVTFVSGYPGTRFHHNTEQQ